MRKMDCDFCFRKSKANTSWMSRSLHTWLNQFKESPSINCCSKIYCHAARVIMGKSRFGLLRGATAGFIIAWLDFSFTICLRLFYFFSHWNLLKPIAFLPLFIDLCKLCLCNAFLIEFSILLFFFSNFIMQDYFTYTCISIPYFDIYTHKILPFHPWLYPEELTGTCT